MGTFGARLGRLAAGVLFLLAAVSRVLHGEAVRGSFVVLAMKFPLLVASISRRHPAPTLPPRG